MTERARSVGGALAFTLLLTGCAASSGVEPDWLEQIAAGDEAALRADYAQARRAYERALDRMDSGPGVASHRARVLRLLAQLEDAQNNRAAAETLLLEALDLVQRTYGDDHPQAGWVASDLGPFYQAQHRYAEAEYFHRRALRILEPVLDPEDDQLGVLLNNLGSVLVVQDQHDEGIELIERALDLARRSVSEGAEIPLALFTLNAADAYRSIGRLEEAEAAYKSALAAQRVSNGYRVNVVSMSALDGLGQVEEKRGDLHMAATLYRAAIGVGAYLLEIEDHQRPGPSLHEHIRTQVLDVQKRYGEVRALLDGRWI